MINEFNRNPEKIFEMLVFPVSIIQKLENQIINDRIKIAVNPKNLVVNIISLCAFPFLSKKILTDQLFDKDETRFNMFIDQRKDEIIKLIQEAVI